MNLPFSDAFRVAVMGMPAAPALAFGMGVISSISPCLTMRAAVLRSVLIERVGAARAQLTCAFFGGLLCAFLSIGYSASLWYRIARASEVLYAILAIVLAIAGASVLTRDRSAVVPCVKPHIRASCGRAFVSGAAMGLLGSPCCMPAAASIAALAALSASHGSGAFNVLCFGLGNAMPLVAAAIPCDLSRFLIGSYREAVAVVSAGVLLSLSAYYAVLA